MYEELVKSLRVCGRMTSIDDNCISYVNGCCEAFPDCAYALMDDAADAIEDLSKPRWIPVTDRLPEFEGAVLCMRKSIIYGVRPYQEILYVDEYGFKNFDDIYLADGVVTHWMPLPQPPKEE